MFTYSVRLLPTRVNRQGVLCLYVRTVTDFHNENKASGVKLCRVVHQRPGQGISHFGELCSPRSPNSDKSASHREVLPMVYILTYRERPATDAPFVKYRTACGRKIGMCG